jgi:hypothetical protein
VDEAMADNNLARNRNDAPDFFADGDPLAELARIVGYEERVVAVADPVAPPTASVPRRDPVFNLEDELLQAFERYDAPRLDPVDDVAVDHTPGSALGGGDHRGLTADEPTPVAVEAPQVDPVHHSQPSAEVVSDVEPYAGHSAPEAVVSDDSAPLPPDVADTYGAEDFQFAAVEPVAPAGRPQPTVVVDPAPALDVFDLAAELETSFAPAVSPAPQPAADLRRKPNYTPSFRMPLANFQSGAGVTPVRPQEPAVLAAVAAPVVVPPVAEPTFTSWTAPVVAAPLTAVELPLAGPVESVAANKAAAAEAQAPAAPALSPFDELLYDVDRYASPSPANVAAAPSAVAAPVAPVEAPKAAKIEPAKIEPSLELEDAFGDMDFDLSLDDLELDLAEMVAQEAAASANRVAQPAPAPVAPPVAAVAAQPLPAPAPAHPVAPTIVPTAAAPMVAVPVAANVERQDAPNVVTAPVARPEPVEAPVSAMTDADDDLAFDPSLFAESEDHPEAIAELDVPALPVEEPEEAPVYRNDFDLDIDAELASLLESSEVAAPQPEPAKASAAPAVAAAPAAPKHSVHADLDEFERALEEDFRRSLAAPMPERERYAVDGDEAEFEGRTSGASVRRWIAPLAAVGVLAVCGAGAYAWLGSSVPGVGGNGEPIVIAADNDPVKVAPENPGGKTVPNQDKAVYDRVAGAVSDAPKQQQLISSSEEPVDVVQKTLMPDSLPLEGENEAEITEVSDTEDPRLLPQDQAEQGQSGGQQPVTVMPRKVKTMIVRADGKLVEQETEVSAPVEKVAAASAKGDMPVASQPTAAPFPTASVPTDASASGIMPASAPMTAAPASVEMASAAPAEDPVAALAASESVEPAETTASVRAPLPTARPAQQPAKVVAAVSDQGTVRPAATPAAATPAAGTQVASLGNGDYVIQIASLPSQADAQKSYQNLSNKFGSVIGGRGVDIKAAEIAGKGTFYRVRIPAGSKTEAVALCERYRSAGGSCLVAK